MNQNSHPMPHQWHIDAVADVFKRLENDPVGFGSAIVVTRMLLRALLIPPIADKAGADFGHVRNAADGTFEVFFGSGWRTGLTEARAREVAFVAREAAAAQARADYWELSDLKAKMRSMPAAPDDATGEREG